jgi:hypothetical protein
VILRRDKPGGIWEILIPVSRLMVKLPPDEPGGILHGPLAAQP